jgi:hypothetical protein
MSGKGLRVKTEILVDHPFFGQTQYAFAKQQKQS